EKAALAVSTARDQAQHQCPMYAEQLDTLSADWLDGEAGRMADGVREAQARADKLQRAEKTLAETAAALRVHRGQRAATAEPLADHETPDSLANRQQRMADTVLAAQADRRRLE